MRCPTCDGHGWYFVGMWSAQVPCQECEGACRVPFSRWLALRFEAWRAAVVEWLED